MSKSEELFTYTHLYQKKSWSGKLSTGDVVAGARGASVGEAIFWSLEVEPSKFRLRLPKISENVINSNWKIPKYFYFQFFGVLFSISSITHARVRSSPGKPGKVLEKISVLNKSWNFLSKLKKSMKSSGKHFSWNFLYGKVLESIIVWRIVKNFCQGIQFFLEISMNT